MNVMIHACAFSFNSGEKGLELCFEVLQKLGERFPKSLEDAHIIKELTDTNKQLQWLLPSSLDTLPLMEDKQKLQAMVCVLSNQFSLANSFETTPTIR